MLNRRHFISVSFAALVAGGMPAPSAAFLHRSVPSFPFVFQGNPNVTTSAVDVVTNGIQSSRTITTGTITGNVAPIGVSSNTTGGPFIVQFSASGILCTATNSNGNPVLPYEDLMFVWTDGQGGASDTVVNPTNNLGVVVSTGTQYGPEAIFCYRSVGSYTVTLTVYYQTAPGVYANISTTVTVVTQNNIAATFYVDSVNGNTAWDGTTPQFVSGTTGPKATTADIQTLLNGSISNRQILLCEGSTFTIASGGARLAPQNLQTHNGIRIGSYTYSGNPGAGQKPIINSTAGGVAGGSFALFDFGNSGSGNLGDMVLSNVHFQISGTSTVVACIGCSSGGVGSFGNIYIDNCFCENTLNITHTNVNFSTSVKPSPVWAGVGMWKTVLQSPIVTSSAIGQGAFIDTKQWVSMLGCSVSGSGNNSVLAHHVYPDCYQHSCYRWNTFGETGASGNDQRSFCINMTTVDGDATWHYMGDNAFGAITLTTGSSPQFSHDCADVNNDPAGGGTFGNMVTERNFFVGLTNGGTAISSCPRSETVRLNNFYCGASGPFVSVNPILATIMKSQVYDNNIYIRSTASGLGNFINYNFGSPTFTVNTASPCTFTNTSSARSNGSFIVGSEITIPATVGGVPSGNYFVVSSVYTTAWTIQLSTTKGGSAINNTGSTGTVTMNTTWFGNPQSVFNNSVRIDTASPALWQVASISMFGGNGSIFDNNNYWWGTLPGTKNTQTVFFDSSLATAENYLTWSGAGLDVHATFNQPTWSDPAHGIFS